MTQTSIVLGLADSVDELAATLRASQVGRFETFPFQTFTAPDDAPWDGIRLAMEAAAEIHFSVKGMSKAHFQRWLKSGLHRYEPPLGASGWTNRELYEVLTVEQLRVKTHFYDDLGGKIDEPREWLDCS